MCTQVGNVNSGAIDPVAEICEIAHRHERVGARGRRVRALGGRQPAAATALLTGVELADSWATDAHKWLNVPYDSGLVILRAPRRTSSGHGNPRGYLMHSAGGERDALDYNPEHSRRARGFAVYAALRALGREGVRSWSSAAARWPAVSPYDWPAADDVEVLNQVVLNQVLVRFRAGDGDDDAHTHRVIERVQHDGTCWMSGTTWQRPGGHAYLGVELVDR